MEIDEVIEELCKQVQIHRDENNGAGLQAVFFCGMPLHHFNKSQLPAYYADKLVAALRQQGTKIKAESDRLQSDQ